MTHNEYNTVGAFAVLALVIIHPIFGCLAPIFMPFNRNVLTYVLIVILIFCLAAIVATREVFVSGFPDDLLAYYDYFNSYNYLTFAGLVEATRFEPVFYLTGWLWEGHLSARAVLFHNALLVCAAYFAAVASLGARYRVDSPLVYAFAAALFPFELASNIPRQLFAGYLCVALLFSRWSVLTVLVHKSSILLVLLAQKTRTLLFLVPSGLLAILIFAADFERLFLSRLDYYFIREGQFSWFVIIMPLVVGLFFYTHQLDKEMTSLSRKVLIACVLLTPLMMLGPLGARLSAFFWPWVVIAFAGIFSRQGAFLGETLSRIIGYGVCFAVLGARFSTQGPHEPFSELGISHMLFWGLVW